MGVPFKDGAVEFAGRSNDLSALTGKVIADGSGLSGHLVAYASFFSGKNAVPGNFASKSCKTRDLTFTAQP